MIDKISGHDVVCGYGRMGRAVVAELRQRSQGVVVVERKPERVRELQEAGIPVLAGDATSEATLSAARLETARGLVACLNDDAHNVYTVLTARALKPAIMSFFDASLSGANDLQLDQTSLRPRSVIAGQTLREADLRQRWGLGVMAVQRDN